MMPDNRHRTPASKPVLAALPVENMPEAAWVAQNLPLDETPLAHVFKMLGRLAPVQAGQLAEEYERGVRPALRHARDVESHEHKQRERANTLARKENAGIETQQAALRKERDEATQVDRDRLQRLQTPLAQAHVLAADAQSAADGAEYDPDDPSDARVLNILQRPLEVLADVLNLPCPMSDKKVRMTCIAMIAAIAIFGAVLGVSYGIICQFLSAAHPDSRPLSLLVSLLVGMGIAGLWHAALRQFPFLIGERCSHPRRAWLPFALGAVVIFALFLWVDSTGVSLGLFKFAQAHVSTGSLRNAASHKEEHMSATWFLLTMFCSFPFGLLAVCEGFFMGREKSILNRLLAQQQLELEAAEADRRSRPLVQAALQAVALARSAAHYVLHVTKRIHATAEPFEKQIVLLEERRLPVCAELDEAARERIRAARAKAISTLNEWRGRLETVAGEYVRPRASVRLT